MPLGESREDVGEGRAARGSGWLYGLAVLARADEGPSLVDDTFRGRCQASTRNLRVIEGQVDASQWRDRSASVAEDQEILSARPDQQQFEVIGAVDGDPSGLERQFGNRAGQAADEDVRGVNLGDAGTGRRQQEGTRIRECRARLLGGVVDPLADCSAAREKTGARAVFRRNRMVALGQTGGGKRRLARTIHGDRPAQAGPRFLEA